MKITLALAAAMALFAAPALAQSADTKPAAGEPDVFAIIDADANGEVTLEEVQKVDSSVTAKDFAKYDTDADKSLTKMEFANWDADIKAAKAGKSG